MWMPYRGHWTLAGDPSDYKSYRIAFGRDVVIKDACELVGCLAWRYGWKSEFDESTDLGRRQAHFVRHRSGRTFKEQRTEAGLSVFIFEPHQRCFAEHKTQPNFFSVRLGDNRANFGLLRQHTRGLDWAEDCAEHQLRLADEIKKG